MPSLSLRDNAYVLTGLSLALLYGAAKVLKNGLGSSRRQRAPYPPGPKGYPIINNLLEIPSPSEEPWLVYEEMAKEYGDMIFLRAFSQPILILGSAKRINDLLDQRSSTYSGRPYSIMLDQLLDWCKAFSLMDYTPRWRKQRKMFHQNFNPTMIPQYHPIIREHVQQFLTQVAASPEEHRSHIRHLIGGVIMHITYGYKPKPTGDPCIAIAHEVEGAFKIVVVPGAFLVDNIPLLKYVPAWMPGAGFQRFAAYYKKADYLAKSMPYQFVMDAMKRDEAEPCAVTRLVKDLPNPEDPRYAEHEEDIINVAGVSYLAGTDTTTGVMTMFIFLMVLHPEVQRKAQAELDRVCGTSHLPDFGDREELVYVKAVVTELLRWYQATPMAVPHTTSEDNYYDGYFIPKGTIVMGNAWAVLHDPGVFENPMEFNPERYIKDGKFNTDLIDPMSFAFGFGRRICPGMHLVKDVLYLMVASTLASFEIHPLKDESGTPKNVQITFDSGVVVLPGHFDTIIRPRSGAAERLSKGFSD
ncbi:hypothetical protein MD484_g2275, partial [Candolleomyces efflorescens]